MKSQLEFMRKAFTDLEQSIQSDKNKGPGQIDSATDAQAKERDIFKMLRLALSRAKRLIDLL